MPTDDEKTLVLHPFRATRPNADGDELAARLCPPYDVITAERRTELEAASPWNAVRLILPDPATPDNPFAFAADLLDTEVARGVSRVDEMPALYVYEMTAPDGAVTRGLVGAVELRDPELGVILPHENTMPGPVAGRLALMQATAANHEPIYLVYDGAGAATKAVADVASETALADAVTPDGVRHRLWAITAAHTLAAIAEDLRGRTAMIADGHHRYATYRELQRIRRESEGPGAWDRGLTLLVEATNYGPQVHPIHRVVRTLGFDDAVELIQQHARVTVMPDATTGLADAQANPGFAMVLSDGNRFVLVTELQPSALATLTGPPEYVGLDVVVLHHLVGSIWQRRDDEETVNYAHSVAEALDEARDGDATAVLLRPTPVQAVNEVARLGLRMPRKSTFFTPKPASGLLLRRFVDDTD